WLEEHYTEKFRLEDVASRHGMSIRNFMRRFQAATGDKPLHYLQRLRVETAKNLLTGSRKSIKTISYEVGYDDASFFARLFRQHTGLSPNQYRQHTMPRGTGTQDATNRTSDGAGPGAGADYAGRPRQQQNRVPPHAHSFRPARRAQLRRTGQSRLESLPARPERLRLQRRQAATGLATPDPGLRRLSVPRRRLGPPDGGAIPGRPAQHHHRNRLYRRPRGGRGLRRRAAGSLAPAVSRRLRRSQGARHG